MKNIGDKVTLYFDEPSAIGYNGIWCEIKMKLWDEKRGEYKYYVESVNGSARCWAYEENFR